MRQTLGVERPSRGNGGAGNGTAHLHTGCALFVLLRRTFQPGHPRGRAALLRGDPWNANLLHPRSEFAPHAADG